MAVTFAESAVRATHKEHSSLAGRLGNLGVMLRSGYERTGEMKDLEEAIRVARLAVDSTPEDHPDRAGWLSNLVKWLGRGYEQTGQITLTLPLRPLLEASQGHFGEAAELARDVIDLLSVVNNRYLDRRDRQYVMFIFSGIAADSCALFLETRKPRDALQYLEKGRAVILSQLMDDRSDISNLQEHYPELASTYDSLRDEVNRPPGDLEDGSKRTDVLKRHRAAVEELDFCIQAIRRLPGFDRFLFGQTTAEMQACAVGGSIVLVNVTEMRSDALINSSTEIRTLVHGWLKKRWMGGKSERGKRNQEYLGYLSWLWEVCVKQVLGGVCAAPGSSTDDLHEYGGSGLD
ncbi:MAG: hypothetical protein M1816_008250 [Peltula sp. TS41687]|nr:MAG: hypothetical protein M1816_008250 [Peltula sp. TS41687]